MVVFTVAKDLILSSSVYHIISSMVWIGITSHRVRNPSEMYDALTLLRHRQFRNNSMYAAV